MRFNRTGCGLALINLILWYYVAREWHWAITASGFEFQLSQSYMLMLLLNFPSISLTDLIIHSIFDRNRLAYEWDLMATYDVVCYFSIDVVFAVVSSIQWYIVGLVITGMWRLFSTNSTR